MNKFVFLFVLISSYSFADFKQNQVRYMGYYDLINTLSKKLNTVDYGCSGEAEERSEAFGFALPVKGEPISSQPNFNFLNTLLQCIKSSNTLFPVQNSTPGFNIDSEYNINYPSEPAPELKVVLKSLIEGLIGPDAVVKSYGHVESLDALTEIIYQSTVESLNARDIQIAGHEDFYKTAINFIVLRDEFLSY